MPNKHLYYPPAAMLPYCSTDEEVADLIDGNDRYFAAEAAELVDFVADHNRDDWADKRMAVKLRSILRVVSKYLREKADA